MAEEHRCKSPEGHLLCANNCGFFGSPTTLNLCSKCYRDLRLKEEQASSAKFAVEKSLAASSSSSSTVSLITVQESSADDEHLRPISIFAPPPPPPPPPPSSESAAPATTGTQPNRCLTCRKRIGLTGFKCRCGITFCTSHRYPEQHGCTFDFKTSGRESIAKANPLIKAEKLDKI